MDDDGTVQPVCGVIHLQTIKLYHCFRNKCDKLQAERRSRLFITLYTT